VHKSLRLGSEKSTQGRTVTQGHLCGEARAERWADLEILPAVYRGVAAKDPAASPGNPTKCHSLRSPLYHHNWFWRSAPASKVLFGSAAMEWF